jgi:predicted dehydrogenase
MARKRFRVGIVGLQPGRSWAARAHVPALRALADDFEIAGVANTSRASAEAAAKACELPRAYDDVAALLADPNIDIVTVTVKVAHHREIVSAALKAGKHVYCEWPLGRTLAEAEEMADLAGKARVLAVCGTQARVSPEIEHLRGLIADSAIDTILSATIIGTSPVWAGTIPDSKTSAYLLEREHGATMLTIPFGHMLAALRDVLGDIGTVQAILATRRTTATALDSGESLPVSAPDQIVVNGVLSSGAPISLHYRGGMPRDGSGMLWEINGTKADLRLTAASGHIQTLKLSLQIGSGSGREWQAIDVPAGGSWPQDPVPGNVARVYARMANDLRDGTRTAPGFDDAVQVHRLIDAIEQAAGSRP